MLMKIIRITIIISILIINMYSYANVTVSDGSSFITKSEMAYTLNNLSNRMSQLENSLDSKIDTLVSSYLTRNGIWNGDKQKIEKKQILDYWKAMNITSITPDFNAVMTSGTLSYGVEYKLKSGSWTLINSCNKSGLLFGKFIISSGYDYAKSISPSVGTDGRNFAYFQGDYRNNPICSNTSEVSLWINDVCMYSSVPVIVGLYRTLSNSTGLPASCYFVPKPGVSTPSFFVNKGDKVTVYYDVSITPQTDDAKNNWQNRTFVQVGSAPGVAVVFDDFYIY